jgi:hypothetical protein
MGKGVVRIFCIVKDFLPVWDGDANIFGVHSALKPKHQNIASSESAGWNTSLSYHNNRRMPTNTNADKRSAGSGCAVFW